VLFPLPLSIAAIVNLVVHQHRKMSGNIDSIISKSGLVQNMRVAFEIALLSQVVQKLLPLPFYGRHLGFPEEAKETSDFFSDGTIEKPVAENEKGRHRIRVSSWSMGEVREGNANLHPLIAAPPRHFRCQRLRCSGLIK
jgi:hypothetical protein